MFTIILGLSVFMVAHAICGNDGDAQNKQNAPIIIDSELFYKVARSKDKEVKLGEGLVGYVKVLQGKNVVFVEQKKIRVPPGKRQLFVFKGSPTAMFWYPPEKLVTVVPEEEAKKIIPPDPEKKDGGKMKVGVVGVVDVFEFIGRKGITPLQFEYKRGHRGPVSWVYKVKVEG